MQLAQPYYLLLFLLFIPIIIWYILKHGKSDAPIEVSSVSAFNKLPTTYKAYLKHLLFALRLMTISCLIIVLCRPYTRDSWKNTFREGTDIVIALDISSSMLARDFKPDRFDAAKDVASQFISGRQNDNIGIVIFAGESFTLTPMTTDHAVLLNMLHEVQMGMLEDGTAIGDGLATAVNRIKSGKAKSKSIILLTDGSNNTGTVAPLTAAQAAKEYGVRVYTIGVGKNGMAPYPATDYYGRTVYQNMPVVIDEASLKQIASITDGEYFRATNKSVLNDVFKKIDALEKTKMDIKQYNYKEEAYLLWAVLALIFILLEIVLRNTILRKIP